ncbi:FAD-dependent oxidoreductase [Novosphingobium sp. PP1Y]|uniref:FAD-dependent oxidoreductase n=1 Tax=Novosphingobium sp. PP1Y TaxID=702113 RepID=UPI00020EF3F2|nr:FAD-dependent oxidoreductase [Novosphingobium sp. PP1Y]CCA94043.1 conserved hypothetical protein [Novosphingobium sp. PP1Y]
MLDPRPSHAAETVVVLGAGIAGLAAADRLADAGFRVTVIDRRSACGGIHRSRQIDEYTFDVGCIFYEDNAKIFALAPDIKELCPEVRRIQRRISPSGNLLHYPLDIREIISEHGLRLWPAALDLALSRIRVKRDGTLDAISRQRLGSRFFDATGLRAYMARYHHRPPNQIDEEFFFCRMGQIEKSTRLNVLLRTGLASLLRSSRSQEPRRRPLRVRPQRGFDIVFDRIAAALAAKGVRFELGQDLQAIRSDGKVHMLRTDKACHFADAVVSTIPIDTLHQALFGTASGLVSLDMTTLFVSARWIDPEAGNVLFNFHRDGRWKRATIYSRIYAKSVIRREYLAVETTIPPGGQHDPLSAFDDFCRHATVLGVAHGLSLEGHERVENCYPLHTPGTRARVQSLLAKISSKGIVTAGRQGRFEYLPTSSGVIRRVIEELEVAGLAKPSRELAA